MIAILDYGAGNLRSVQNTLEEIGAGSPSSATPIPSAPRANSSSPASATSAK